MDVLGHDRGLLIGPDPGNLAHHQDQKEYGYREDPSHGFYRKEVRGVLKRGTRLKCTPNSGPNQKAGYFSYEVHIRAEAEMGERLHVRGMGAHPRRMPEFNR